MGRSTQFIGHTNDVDAFLSQCTKLEKIEEVRGMFGESVADLHKFKDVLGTEWEEFIQDEPWSSGPMIFLAIRNVANPKEIKGWTVEQQEHENVDHEKGTYWA